MKIGRKSELFLAVIIFASFLVLSCRVPSIPNPSAGASPYWKEQRDLTLKHDRGEITDEEYKDGLKNLRDAQPWDGGVRW
jgi:hypothetical protein